MGGSAARQAGRSEIGDEGTGAGQPTSAPGEAGDLPEGAGLEAARQTAGIDEPEGGGDLGAGGDLPDLDEDSAGGP